MSIEKIGYTSATMKYVLGKKLTLKNELDSNNNALMEFFAYYANQSIIIDEVIYSNLGLHGNEVFMTFHNDLNQADLDQLPGDKIKLIELLVSGTGVTRSYENISELYKSLEQNGVNILGQACTDLYIRLYISREDEKVILKSLLDLGIANFEHIK